MITVTSLSDSAHYFSGLFLDEHEREWLEKEAEREAKRKEIERARQELETRRRIEARLRAKQEAESKARKEKDAENGGLLGRERCCSSNMPIPFLAYIASVV